VKIVLGPSHNVLVVEMDDHVVAVDAPLYDEYTRAALAQVKRAFPGKPLRKVVGTHFDYDHIGGIREFVADGECRSSSARPAWRISGTCWASPHTVDPDRLAGHPVETEVIGVNDHLELPAAAWPCSSTTAFVSSVWLCKRLSAATAAPMVTPLPTPRLGVSEDGGGY
jgi:glyoxylase-like metal-dependent hydrolase (beta-lactamase superfamily II)